MDSDCGFLGCWVPIGWCAMSRGGDLWNARSPTVAESSKAISSASGQNAIGGPSQLPGLISRRSYDYAQPTGSSARDRAVRVGLALPQAQAPQPRSALVSGPKLSVQRRPSRVLSAAPFV